MNLQDSVEFIMHNIRRVPDLAIQIRISSMGVTPPSSREARRSLVIRNEQHLADENPVWVSDMVDAREE
jgi:hypothetical protein